MIPPTVPYQLGAASDPATATVRGRTSSTASANVSVGGASGGGGSAATGVAAGKPSTGRESVLVTGPLGADAGSAAGRGAAFAVSLVASESGPGDSNTARTAGPVGTIA